MSDRPATKVLHVLDELRPSGAETTLVVAGPRWAARDVDADVLATGEELGSYAAALRAAGYRTGRIPLDPFRSFAPRFRRLLRDEGYDVVHNHVERANAYVALVARSAGVRVVQSLHGLWDFDGAARLERTAMRAVMRAIGVEFVAVSDAVRDNERARFANPTRVITNWFDDTAHHLATPAARAAARTALGLGPDDRVLASVGNCSTIKNHRVLLEAMAMLDRPDLVYLHGGTGPELADERALADSLGIAGQVRFLGFTPADPLLRAADVFAMPSLHEGQGIAAIEAVATGTPTLLADSPGLRTLAALQLSVRWAAPTPDAMAAGLAELLDAPPPADRLAADARTVTEHFGPDGPLDALAALYRGE